MLLQNIFVEAFQNNIGLQITAAICALLAVRRLSATVYFTVRITDLLGRSIPPYRLFTTFIFTLSQSFQGLNFGPRLGCPSCSIS